MQLTAGEIAALDSGLVRVGLFFWMDDTPSPIRLWLGVGKIEPGTNTLDPTGQTYLGAGELRHVPEFSQLINGQAERVEFLVSGVSGPLFDLIGTANDVKGARVALGFGLMNGDWQLIGPIRWARLFYADYLGISQTPTEDGVVRALTLSCGSLMTGRKRPGLAYYSDADQQRRFPGDKGCERVPTYAQEVRKTWPRF